MNLFFISAKYLSAYKIKASSYHAGISDSKRQLVQNQWANDDCQVKITERNFIEKGVVDVFVGYLCNHCFRNGY